MSFVFTAKSNIKTFKKNVIAVEVDVAAYTNEQIIETFRSKSLQRSLKVQNKEILI